MSLKKNILANYASQLYITLIGIVLVPTYLRYMGPEAYGLVGFFTMLQAWFQLLDVGLTPTLSRETARFNAGVTDEVSFRRLLSTLELLFILVAVISFLAMVVGSDRIATHWLHVEKIPVGDVKVSIILMAGTIAFRWVGGLYRGVINGFEKFLWISNFNIVISTVKFVVIVPVMIFLGASPLVFFGYQLAIALVEIMTLFFRAKKLIPSTAEKRTTLVGFRSIKGLLSFSLSIAFTNSIWILVTQTDKLVLSKILSLSQYAYFTLGVLVASAVSVLSGPISGALLPRMAKMSAAGNDNELQLVYGKATQLVTFVVTPIVAMLAFFSKEILWAWTGDHAVANNTAPILSMYAIGNGILAIAAFPYYLQYAKGDLRLHLIGSAVFVAVLAPALIFLTTNYGVTGAGYAWVGANAIYFICWVPLVHRRFFRNFHIHWLLRNVFPSIAVSLACIVALRHIPVLMVQRFETWVVLFCLGIVVMFASACGSSYARDLVLAKVFGKFQREAK
ncbi:oligosaccharide flippase family protein [Massilia sp. CT11-108]|uniref:oligosaccharide flippase family protein n=1 Tax=Massilia sp. CT11-108 TaxID=3393900 RepID=UPI0039A4A383